MSCPRSPRLGRIGLAAAMVVLGVVPAATVGGASSPDPSAYRPPLVAPVADPFRPPPEPWLAGNRGIEYRTVPGTSVGAIGPGTVAFAGLVAGVRIVSIDHPDGLRSSSVHLSWIGVEVGQQVAAGERIGRSSERLHLGVRRGDTYLDPASLWGTSAGRGRVVLVPTDDEPDTRPGPSTPEAGPGRPRLGAADLAGPALGLVVAATVASLGHPGAGP